MPNVPAVPESSGALTLPDDVRQDLLRAQMNSMGDQIKRPRVRMLPQGVNLFEFIDTNETTRELEGVVLGGHSRQALWDKEYGSTTATDEQKFPACSRPHGLYGVPRVGFRHAALSEPATGTERILCETCPYDQFGSGNMLVPSKNPRGRACSRSTVVYLAMADRMLPVELSLPVTSMTSYDRFIGQLFNRSTPVQSVLTKITLQRIEKNGMTYSVANFASERSLTQAEFTDVLELLRRFRAVIDPQEPVVAQAAGADGATDALDPDAAPAEASEEDDDIPF
jgi:hypothetical protein